LSKNDWQQPQWLLCYKHEQQVYIKHLNEHEYLLVNHLSSGASIEESLTRTMQDCPDLTASTVSNVFQIINHTGIVTHLETASPMAESIENSPLATEQVTTSHNTNLP
jgi:hypothetical protein